MSNLKKKSEIKVEVTNVAQLLFNEVRDLEKQVDFLGSRVEGLTENIKILDEDNIKLRKIILDSDQSKIKELENIIKNSNKEVENKDVQLKLLRIENQKIELELKVQKSKNFSDYYDNH